MLACSAGAPWLLDVARALGALLVLAAIADLALGPRRSALEIRRIPAEHFAMRVLGELRYEITNRSPRFARVGLVEAPVRTLFYEDDEVCANVPARARAIVARRVVPVARGGDELTALFAWSENALGLFRRRWRVAVSESVRVYPDLSAVERYGRLDVRNRFVEAGLRRMRMFGAGTEFESLREYAAGDSFRAIDWKASARRGRIMEIGRASCRERV